MRMRRIPPTVLVSLLVFGCASVKTGNGTATGGGGGSSSTTTGHGGSTGSGGSSSSTGSGSSTGTVPHDCVDLECYQTKCSATKCLVDPCGENEGQETTLSGIVYDPAGKVPLYNVVVYVPNAPLDAVPEGVSCQKCDGTASGKPIASALTDANGHFVLKNPPVGKNVPLVLQVGKWRREVQIPIVNRCMETAVDDHDLLRLPRTQSEGHMPLIALSTGHSDADDCLLRKIGIADQEFTTDAGTGRVHMYRGLIGDSSPTPKYGASKFVDGTTFPDAYTTLFANEQKMNGYDMIILQCEGKGHADVEAPYMVNMKRYADGGGRIFDGHMHFSWIAKGPPPWPATGDWLVSSLDTSFPPNITGTIDTTFPKGMSFNDWLANLGATPTPNQIALTGAEHSVNADIPGVSQRWIYSDSPGPSVQYMTFNTPVEVPAPNQCGRVVFTDIHVGSGNGDSSDQDTPFPLGCTSTTDTPQQLALEFMFFDLSSCIQEDHSVPIPPPVVE